MKVKKNWRETERQFVSAAFLLLFSDERMTKKKKRKAKEMEEKKKKWRETKRQFISAAFLLLSSDEKMTEKKKEKKKKENFTQIKVRHFATNENAKLEYFPFGRK